MGGTPASDNSLFHPDLPSALSSLSVELCLLSVFRSPYRARPAGATLLPVTQDSNTSVHTPSIAFLHLPPNSARFRYAAEGALDLYVRAAVQRCGQRPPKGSGTNMTVEAT